MMKNYKYSAITILFPFILFHEFKLRNLLNQTEFRIVWIATVVNIDWQKTKQRQRYEQKRTTRNSRYVSKLNYNIVQIRVLAMLYLTKLAVVKIFNWKKGKAPTPYYDQRVDDK
jgi:trans-aconitate methyltransferase